MITGRRLHLAQAPASRTFVMPTPVSAPGPRLPPVPFHDHEPKLHRPRQFHDHGILWAVFTEKNFVIMVEAGGDDGCGRLCAIMAEAGGDNGWGAWDHCCGAGEITVAEGWRGCRGGGG
jgi:hypothetical protein